MLPNINVEYNFLTEEVDQPRYLNTNDFKAAINVSFPLFLRKERGELRLAKVKRENTNYKLSQKEWNLTNKIKAIEREIISLQEQLSIIENIIEENKIMVDAEKRLFDLGESSIFLINTRENKLIDAQLKQNKLQNDYYNAIAKLFENLRIIL
ncbi:TolC family protein [Mesonia maritima]|uniref:TolC family protein n=1 Tax=Mesonia maritima TaxID=1793873 RepID=UPI00363C36FE